MQPKTIEFRKKTKPPKILITNQL